MASESLIKLRNLTTKEGEPLEQIIQRGVEQMVGLKENATLQLRITGGPDPKGNTNYSIALTQSGAFLQPTPQIKPTLVVIVPHDSFMSIVDGSYSPLQAYLDGKLKPIGDVDLGKRIIIHLGGSGTQAAVCPMLFNESWTIDSPGQGHISFSGEFFTPSGFVQIVYDWGAGFYHQIARADATGIFTTTQGALHCGDIPGQPGVGVIVTATDIATGKYITQKYGTPCR